MKTRQHQCRIQLAASEPVAYRLVTMLSSSIITCFNIVPINVLSYGHYSVITAQCYYCYRLTYWHSYDLTVQHNVKFRYGVHFVRFSSGWTRLRTG